MNALMRTRLRICVIAFFTVIGTAILKNWLPGISETMVGLAVVNVLGYGIYETLRPSKKGE